MGTQQPHTHNVPSMQHRSVGQFIKDEIAGPLGVEIYVGVPPSERRRLTDMHAWPASYMLTNAVSNRLRESGRLEQERYLRRPRSVRIDDEFRLFIPDYESYRIQVYQKDFIPLDRAEYADALRNPTLEVT